MGMVTDDGAQVSVVSVAGETVIPAVPVSPPNDALMVLNPTPSALTLPAVTAATVPSLENHDADAVTSAEVPSAKFAVALSTIVPPTDVVAADGLTINPTM